MMGSRGLIMHKSAIGTLFALSMFYAHSASAIGASVGVLAGNGFKDGYNLGFGARGGVTLPLNVYVGGTLVYHLGKSESISGLDVKQNLFYLGAEGGYELGLG